MSSSQKLESALKKIDELERLLLFRSKNEAVGEMFGTVVHQWLEPLGALGAILAKVKANLVLKGEIEKEKLLKSIQDSNEIIEHLSNTVSTFSGSVFRANNDTGFVDIQREIETIKKVYGFSSKESDIRVKMQDNGEIFIRGNSSDFFHLLANIISNADEALHENNTKNPLIIITVSRDETHHIVAVEDNGGGIKIEPIEKIFEPSISSKESSSGLGLFISKTIVEQRLNGSLSAQNTKDGAKFVIRLPICDEEMACELKSQKPKRSSKKIEHLQESIFMLEQMERTLRKWVEVFDKAEWGIAVVDPNSGRLEMLNPAFAKMHGFEIKELIGTKVISLFSKSVRKSLKKSVDGCMSHGYNYFESEHLKKDGELFPVSIDCTAVRDKDGEIIYNIINVKDITDKKEMLKQYNAMNHALELINEAVFIADTDGTIIYTNKEACSTLGYKKDELLGMHIADVDTNYPKDGWRVTFLKIKEVGSFVFESSYKTKDGDEIPIELHSNYFEYEGRGYIMWLARDIRERLAYKKETDILIKNLLITQRLAKIGSWIYDIREDSLYWSFEMRAIFGAQEAHFVPTMGVFLEFSHKDDKEMVKKAVDDAIKNGKSYELYRRITRADGTIVEVYEKAEVVFGDDKKPKKIEGISHEMAIKTTS